MAQVVCFETDVSVAETIDLALTTSGVDHVCYLVPSEMVRSIPYFLEVLEEQQPRIILVEPEYIPEEVLLGALRPLRYPPALWAYTRLDSAALKRRYPFLWVERIFEKPVLAMRVAEELQRFLGIPPGRPV